MVLWGQISIAPLLPLVGQSTGSTLESRLPLKGNIITPVSKKNYSSEFRPKAQCGTNMRYKWKVQYLQPKGCSEGRNHTLFFFIFSCKGKNLLYAHSMGKYTLPYIIITCIDGWLQHKYIVLRRQKRSSIKDMQNSGRNYFTQISP